MGIDPTTGGQVLIATIQGETLALICSLFAQCLGITAGIGLSIIFSGTWRG